MQKYSFYSDKYEISCCCMSFDAFEKKADLHIQQQDSSLKSPISLTVTQYLLLNSSDRSFQISKASTQAMQDGQMIVWR